MTVVLARYQLPQKQTNNNKNKANRMNKKENFIANTLAAQQK